MTKLELNIKIVRSQIQEIVDWIKDLEKDLEAARELLKDLESSKSESPPA